VRTRFDPAVTSAVNRESGWLESDGGLIAVSTRRLFPPRVFTVVAGRVEFEWLDHVEVVIERPGEPARSILLSAARRSAEALLPAAGDGPTTVTAHWRGQRDEPQRSDPPREVHDDFLVLDSPFGDSIDVLVAPLPIPGVATVIVELKALDGGAATRTVSWDAPDRTPRRVGLRRLAGSPREYAYRVEFIHENGTVERKDWVTARSTTLVIGGDRPVEVRRVEVVLLGGGPAGRDSFAVELVFESGAARVAEVLEGQRDSATLTLVVPQGAPPAVLVAREFLNSGEIRETRWTDPPALIAMAPLPVVSP
jgi:hypothetical protein